MKIFLLLICLLAPIFTFVRGYDVIYYDQLLDHYSEISFSPDKTFKQRVLVDDTSFNKKWCQKNQGENCALFFYSGNEGPITDFYENSGYIMELAAEYKALVVFGEHRFYGESLPFGIRSFEWPHIGLLTVDQAVADYARLLVDFKANYSIPNATVISFGGSYGGMLSAFLRFKFPNVVKGALASSAPVRLAAGDKYRDRFWSSVTQDYTNVGEDVSARVREGFTDLDNLALQGRPGYETMSQYFRLCKPIRRKDDYTQLLYTIRNAFVVMTMFDYPESADFMSPLPAWPVNASSALIRASDSAIDALVAVTNLVYNSTKDPVECFNIYELYFACADPTGCGLGNDATAWNFQVCYELNLAFGSNGVTDMFPYLPWDDAQRDHYCELLYPIKSRHDWFAINYWGSHVWASTNIIWSNGRLDPWYRSGIKESSDPTQPIVIIDDGAHHVDLRASSVSDTPTITRARLEESSLIEKILNKHQD